MTVQGTGKLDISLRDLLEYGNFGELHPGTPESKIIATLGPFDNFHSPSEGAALRATWLYGSIEFWTVPVVLTDCLDVGYPNENICEGIFIEASGPDERGPFLFPENCSVIDWGLPSGTNSDAAIEYLHNNGFMEREAYPNSDPYTLIVEGSHVLLTFDDNRLHSIFVGLRTAHVAKL